MKYYGQYDMPAIWASYLINSDPSGLTDEEIKQCDDYCHDLGQCIEVSEASFYGIFKGIGCEMSTYKFVTL